MEPSVIFWFAAAAAMMIALPGPDWALVLAAGVRARSAVAPTVGGLAVGYAAVTGTVAAGVAPLVAATPGAWAALTLGGAAYLIHVGVTLLRQPASRHGESLSIAPLSRRDLFVRGIGVSTLNPKALLFFLALLPQFADPRGTWPVMGQLITFGGIWVALVCALYTLLGRTAARMLAARPRHAEVLTRVAGTAMVLAGLALLAEHLRR